MNLVLSDSTKFRESADCFFSLSATSTTVLGSSADRFFRLCKLQFQQAFLLMDAELLQGLRDIRRFDAGDLIGPIDSATLVTLVPSRPPSLQ